MGRWKMCRVDVNTETESGELAPLDTHTRLNGIRAAPEWWKSSSASTSRLLLLLKLMLMLLLLLLEKWHSHVSKSDGQAGRLPGKSVSEL